MSKNLSVSVISLFIILTSSPLRAASSVGLFPTSRTKAEFVSPVFDHKALEIGAKWGAAMEKEKVFFSEYASKHAERNPSSGAALPWHEKMGVTNQDYAYMVEKLRRPQLKKMFDAEIDVEKKGSKLVIITSYSGITNAPLVFDTETEQMTVGRISYGKPSMNAGRSQLELIGRYVPGYEWKLSKNSSASGYIHIGRLQEEDKCLLNLSVLSGPPAPIMGSFRYKC